MRHNELRPSVDAPAEAPEAEVLPVVDSSVAAPGPLPEAGPAPGNASGGGSAPARAVMEDRGADLDLIGRHEVLRVAQTTRGFLGEMLGCEAEAEFKVTTPEQVRQSRSRWAAAFAGTGCTSTRQ